MRYLFALCLIAGLARHFEWGPFKQHRLDRGAATQLIPLNDEAAAADPCAGVQRCVIAYLAPWCPSCKSSKPLLREVRAQLPAHDAALKLIVGMSDRARAQAMAAELGGPVFFDPDGAFHHAMGGTGVPYWLVLDRSHEVKARLAGYVTPVRAHLERLGF